MVYALISKHKPSPKTAFRGIAIFPSLYRLWVRARRWQVLEWEASRRKAFFAFQRGAGVVAAVWRQAAVAEAAVASK
eukprot:7115356-Lingulodinium_polyedra.AAC.1